LLIEVVPVALNKAKALANAQRHLQKNNIDRALRELIAVIKDDPKDLRTRQKVAELQARQGRYPEAMKEFTLVAESYAHGGFYPKAVSIYKQMVRIEPDEMAHHLALGEVYQQLAHLSDAMDHFNIVAEHYEQKGTTKDRVKIYKKLSTILPESLEYAEKLAAICLQDADPQAAFEVWRQLAKRLAPKGSSDALVRAYEGMHKYRAEDLELTRKLADLYLDRGQPKKALEKLQDAFKIDSQDTETLNLLADAFVDLGQKDKAVAILKELARIYESVGFADYKNQVFDRIAEIDPAGGAELEVDGSALVATLNKVVEGLSFSKEEELEEPALRALYEAEIFHEYGMSERALGSAEKGLAQFSACFSLQRLLVSLCLDAEDLDRAKTGLNSMYETAMDKGEYRAARDCLSQVVGLDSEDEAAVEKLQAFEDAMGEYVGEPEPLAEPAEVADDLIDLADVALEPLDNEAPEVEPEPAEVAEDLIDLSDVALEPLDTEPSDQDPETLSVVTGEATDLAIPAVSLADGDLELLDNNLFEQLRDEFEEEDAVGDEPAESAAAAEAGDQTVDTELVDDADGEDEVFGEFDFDDEELQRLADEMSAESAIAEEPDEALEEVEPVADEAADKGESAATSAEDDDEVGTGTGFDLSDLFDLDDLDDLDETKPSAFQLGKSYFDSGAWADAVVELKQAVEDNDEVSRSLELLGMAQRRLRDFKGAVSTFRRLLGSSPQDDELVLRVLYELAVTYEAVGKTNPASTLYKKILGLAPGFRDGEAARRLEQLGG